MAWWIFADSRHAQIFRVCSAAVAVGALIGSIIIIYLSKHAGEWAGEWIDELMYLVMLVAVGVSWVIANDQYRRLTAARD